MIEVDLKKLPEGAFSLYKGKKGEFYQVKFDLALVFKSIVIVKFMCGDEVIVKQSVEYVKVH
jgi:hypothetical protein